MYLLWTMLVCGTFASGWVNSGRAYITLEASFSDERTLAEDEQDTFESDGFYKNNKRVKMIAETYSGRTWSLLMDYHSLPSRIEVPTVCGGYVYSEKPVSTFHYLGRGNLFTQLYQMEVNIHEISHGWSFYRAFVSHKETREPMNFNNSIYYYFVDSETEYQVEHPEDQLFSVCELNLIIQPRHRTFRYKTYISDKPNDCQGDILGLLDELNAYYQGCLFWMDIYPYFLNKSRSYAKGFFNWVAVSNGSMDAYFEFTYFILEYLRHMEANYSDEFFVLMNNEVFIEAYKDIQDRFQALVRDFLSLIDKEILRINGLGKDKLNIQGRKFIYRKQRGALQTVMLMNARHKLEALIMSERYNFVKEHIYREHTQSD